MPPAGSAAARRPPARPTATTALGAAALRVRWDRVGRVALLALLLFVALAYIGPARSLLSTWRESNAKQAHVQELQREHEALLQRARALRDPRSVQAEARRLGMVKPGERPYVVQGLPKD
ncbi:MAG TPA: septum formation initiator family protein [Conexibacter sp.]